jgi:glycerophosphoryl diester phosphodiesterase
MKKIFIIIIMALAAAACSKQSDVSGRIVIAHRGASAYLPEHTLECKAMAYAMNPDFIEQDVVLSKDNRAIVIHDTHLDTVTDVAKIFPGRKRSDGRYYVIDFTLDEIKRLTVFERIDLKTGKQVFAGRFPADKKIPFKLSTLEEEIELIQGLNKSTGKNIGIYPELKSPRFHTAEGKDIAKTVIEILAKYGYDKRDSRCYVQSFDPECLKYVRNTLKSDLKLVQLVADNSWDETPGVDYSKMLTDEGLKEIASYADGVGPWLEQIIRPEGNSFTVDPVSARARKLKLKVHPYTFRKDQLPSFVKSADEYHEIIFVRADVDGLFSDFPDVTADFLKRNGASR